MNIEAKTRELLSAQTELFLARTGSYEELERYFQFSFFGTPAQIALIERGDETLIRLYISTFTLDDIAQCLLAQTASKELLLFAAEIRKLKSPKAIQALIERAL